MKEALLLIFTFLKAFTILIGLGVTCWTLVRGLLRKEHGWEGRALKYFFSTAGLVILLMVIEFSIAYLMAF